MELKVLNIQGKETGRKVSLNDSIFGIEPNDHAIYLDSKQFLANQRQGTAKSKHRGEISGSTRKLKRQKGTGTAQGRQYKESSFPWRWTCVWTNTKVLWLQTEQKSKTTGQKVSTFI